MKKSWERDFGKIGSIDGLLVPGQEKVLYDLAGRLKRASTVVEIGSFNGRSTACFGLGRKDSSVKIYAIDTFAGNGKDFVRGIQFKKREFKSNFERNMRSLGLKNVFPVRGISQVVGRTWRKKIDLLFIDGSHIYEDVKADFKLFFPWVKPGGLVLFHDVDPVFPGVYKVWHEMARQNLSKLGSFHTLYFGSKPLSNDVFVILPVHNRLDYTKRCLASLDRQRYKNFEVIVVDDGSADGTAEYLKERYAWTTIRGNGNWWWTKSINKGVEEALSRSRTGDFILTMNNDCYFKSDYLANIVSASEDNNRAVVGSLILDAANPNRVVDAGVKIVWRKNLIYGIADKIARDAKFYRERGVIKDVDTLPGKGTLIPVEVFKKVGNFNHRLLPHYIADYEFFCRAKRFGYKLIVANRARNYNFAKATGLSEAGNNPGPKEILYLLFGRRSKNNIIDYAIFLILTCPRKYLYRNLLETFGRGISYAPGLAKVRLFLHNFPIMVKQNKLMAKVRLFLHNFPIMVKQNKLMARMRLWLHRTKINIAQTLSDG